MVTTCGCSTNQKLIGNLAALALLHQLALQLERFRVADAAEIAHRAGSRAFDGNSELATASFKH